MLREERRVWAARVAAPAAFLVAATAGVLAVRSAQQDEPASRPNPPASTAPRFPAAPPPTAEEPTRFYVVRSGDTLAAIADRNRTTVERLLELNPGIDPVALNVGKRIRVP